VNYKYNLVITKDIKLEKPSVVIAA